MSARHRVKLHRHDSVCGSISTSASSSPERAADKSRPTMNRTATSSSIKSTHTASSSLSDIVLQDAWHRTRAPRPRCPTSAKSSSSFKPSITDSAFARRCRLPSNPFSADAGGRETIRPSFVRLGDEAVEEGGEEDGKDAEGKGREEGGRDVERDTGAERGLIRLMGGNSRCLAHRKEAETTDDERREEEEKTRRSCGW